MARNRKRTRDRRPRRPEAGRPGNSSALATTPEIPGTKAPEPAPPEIDSGDAELAEAQLALGRPELADAEDEEQLDELAEESASSSWDNHGGAGEPPRHGRRGGGVDHGGDGAGGLPPAAGVPSAAGGREAQARTEPIFSRLIHFLQGSWRELQRVQWPDRRQVFQATGVVIGFVIVAGVFLGVSDVVAQKIVSFILNGHG